ncbi:MAG: hypothetical protein RL522_40 [Pseudomonadota bacterium]
MEKINLVVGFDQREAIAYHVFCQSVLERASRPVQFLPLSLNTLSGYNEAHRDGSNTFIYSRFLTPSLMGYSGWALFADGDMVCNADIAQLWDQRDASKAVQVVKHDYSTKMTVKYLGNKNENYPRKNWSSLILWNCGHEANRVLTPELVTRSPGSFLHRFSWLSDELIGELDSTWNWLAIEYPDKPDAKLVHYTLGTPCFEEFADTAMSDLWHACRQRATEGGGGEG